MYVIIGFFYTLYEIDQKKAEKAKEQFERLSRHYPYFGDLEAERELLQIAEERKNRE